MYTHSSKFKIDRECSECNIQTQRLWYPIFIEQIKLKSFYFTSCWIQITFCCKATITLKKMNKFAIGNNKIKKKNLLQSSFQELRIESATQFNNLLEYFHCKTKLLLLYIFISIITTMDFEHCMRDDLI
jgi:hypothetical protein